MQDDIYTGHFTEAQVHAILDAAAPIPDEPIEAWHQDVGSSPVPRDEEMIRRLAEAHVILQAYLQVGKWMSPSELVKQMRGIASSAKRLRKFFGVGEDGDVTKMPPQSRYTLIQKANEYGEEIGGYRHHPPLTFRHGGAQMTTYFGISYLRDCIENIIHIGVLAERVEADMQALLSSAPGDQSGIAGAQPSMSDPVTFALDIILEIWCTVLDREPRMSVHPKHGIANGRLINFALVCLEVLGLTIGRGGIAMDSDAIRARIRRRLEAYEARRTRFSIGH